MKHLFHTTLALALCLFTSGAIAGKFNYSYTDIGALLVDKDGVDATGIGAVISHDIKNDMRLRLGYAYSQGNDIDLWIDDLLVSAGYRMKLDSSMQLVVDAGLITEWFETNAGATSDTTVHLEGALRIDAGDDVELYGGVTYHSLFDDSDLGFNAGVIFSSNPNLSFGINVSSSDVSVTTFFLRFYR